MSKLISQLCGELQPAFCLSRRYEAIRRQPEHSWTSAMTSLRNKLQQSSLGNFQHQYVAELLVNVYSYRLMVKSVSCCCFIWHVAIELVIFQEVANTFNCNPYSYSYIAK